MTLEIDLNILRGWQERRDSALRSAHVLPALAKLEGNEHTPTFTLHGPDVLIGRYNLQHGPVDILPAHLSDAQRYTIGDPHVKFTLVDTQWYIKVISPTHLVKLNDRRIKALANQAYAINHGDHLSLGHCHFTFTVESTPLKRWRRLRRDLLITERQTALFLKRYGSLCGPRFKMNAHEQYTIGRSFPAKNVPYDRNDMPWREYAPPDWDLSGLFDVERRSIAFRHAQISWNKDQWELTPLSKRQVVYINRQRIEKPQALTPGDEVALGSVVFYFHDPMGTPTQSEFSTPNVVNWKAEYTKVTEEPQQ